MPDKFQAREIISRQIKELKEYGIYSEVHRGHCTIWTGWVDMAKILQENGIKMDLSYYPYRYFQSGYLNGSGLPMKFIDENGTILDLYEQSTQWADDVTLTDKTFVNPFSIRDLIKATENTLKESLEIYHTALTFCIHPINMRPNILNSIEWLKSVLEYCKRNNIPVLDATSWLKFTENRRKIRLIDVKESESTFTFKINSSSSINNLTLIVSSSYKGRKISQVKVNGIDKDYILKTINGIEYGIIILNLKEGLTNITIKY